MEARYAWGTVAASSFVEAMRSALRAHLRFANADHIGWPSELRAGKRLFG